jgi:hypothetical protein
MKKYFKDCPNIDCGNTIGYSRKDSYKSSLKKNSECLKCVRKKRGSISDKFKCNKTFKKVLYLYYDLDKTLIDIAKEVELSFETLNKMLKYRNLPKLNRNIKKHDRFESYKKTFKSRYGIPYDEYLKTKSDFYRYKGRVKYYTQKTIKEWGVFIGDLTKVGRGKGFHHVDHIVSIKDCFDYNVDPKIVADIINLRVIPEEENLSKNSNSIFSPEILVKNVNESKENKIYI